jgi:hypothetical protein
MLAGLFNSREILALTPPSGHLSPNSRRGENKHKFRILGVSPLSPPRGRGAGGEGRSNQGMMPFTYT